MELKSNILFSDTHSLYGDITFESKFGMGSRTGMCGAVLCEMESRFCSYLTCSTKLREGEEFIIIGY